MIVRELFAKLGLSVDAASFAVADHMLGAVKSGLGLLVSGAARAGAEMRDVITRTVETASALNDTSVALGVTTEALQELGYAAQLNGSSFEGMADGLRKLSIHMEAAAEGGGEAAEVFRKLGVSVTEGGKLRAADAVLEDIAEKFKAMPDGARKVATAIDLFGKSGASLIPTLTVGREEIVKLREEARGLGVVMSKELIESGDSLGDTWDKLKFAADGLRYAIASPLLEPINEAVKAVIDWVKANRMLIAQRMRVLFDAMGTAIKAFGRGLLLVGRAIGYVIDHWKLFAVLILSTLAAIVLANAGAIISFLALQAVAVASAVASAAAWAAAAAPILAIAALIALVVLALEDIWVFLHGGESLFGKLGLEIKKVFDQFLAAGPQPGEHWLVKLLRSALLYVRAVGKAWEFIFGKMFDGISWMANKIDGLLTRLDMLARIANVRWDITGTLKRGGKALLGTIDSAGSVVGNAAETVTQRLFAQPSPSVRMTPNEAPQSKVINASYAPTIVQQPGQSGTEVSAESQRLWEEWMSTQVEGASAALVSR